MNLPLFLVIGKTADEVAAKWKASVRRDRYIKPSVQEIEFFLYEHASGVVGVMYSSRYRPKDHEQVLDDLGFKLVRVVVAPTIHFKIKAVA